MPPTKLYIGNLPKDTNKDELEDLFQQFGNIKEFDILRDFGFIHFEKDADAKAALKALDGHEYNGRNIKVELSRSKVRQRAGMGGKGECYRCGGVGHWSKECPRKTSYDRGYSRGDRYTPYTRDSFYPDPYDYYARAHLLPPHPYDSIRFDAYDRRLSSSHDRLYQDLRRASPDYYQRSSPTQDLYDYYDRRRLAAIKAYSDKFGGPPDDELEIKSKQRATIHGRVPGPY